MQAKLKEIPMRDVRRTDVPNPEAIASGLDSIVEGWIGRWRSRGLHSKNLWERAGACQQVFDTEIRDLHESPLRSLLNKDHQRVRRLGNRWADEFDAVLPTVVGAAKRSLGIEPYRVQMMGALALAEGTVAEMATGEGKTLTIALAAVVAGWSGRPVHVITANDYLADRDAKNLRVLYELCGLRVSAVTAEMSPDQRIEAYSASVVYCTGKELVADFLRDRILLGELSNAPRRSVERLKGHLGQTRTVLRGIHIGFVDEADNQLIDEAVTPLIISQKEENSNIDMATDAAYRVAGTLLPGEDYELNERQKEIDLLQTGRDKIRAWGEAQDGLLSAVDWMCDLVVTSLQARHFFIKGKQYVVANDELVIVDEFTGRQMPGRSWRLGLHQAVEAKEGLEISKPSETLARLSFQRFYRLFRHLGGISGTARESSDELWRVYQLPFVAVPRHRPNQRVDYGLRLFVSEAEKQAELVNEVLRLHKDGRPLLVGTRSVAVSEQIAELLKSSGADCAVLNAARHLDEAQVIAMAGIEGRITIATNMAGRGTDILIGREVVKRGGLHVVLSEPHESGRVDRQLMGRAGRQGDPGSSCCFASLEDEVVERYLPKWLVGSIKCLCRAKVPTSFMMARTLVRLAQWRAQKVGRYRRIVVLKQDTEMGKRLMSSRLDRI